MFKVIRRSAAAAVLACVLAVAVPFSATPARANPLLLPAVPASLGAVTAATGAICSTGVGCVVMIGALAVGSYVAWKQGDSLVDWATRWFDDDDSTGQGGFQAKSTGADAAYLPGSQTVVLTASTTNISARFRVAWYCRSESGSVAGPYIQSGEAAAGQGINMNRLNVGQMLGGTNKPTTAAGMGFGPGCLDYAGNSIYRVETVVCDTNCDTASAANIVDIWYSPEALAGPINTTTSVTCRKSDGTTAVIVRTQSVADPHSARTSVPSCADMYPGAFAQQIDVTAGPSGGTLQTPQWTWKADVPGMLARYPDCVAGGCELSVEWLGNVCAGGTVECAQWWSRKATHPSDYSCKWGTYTLPLGDCKALRYAYQDGVVYDGNDQPYYAPGSNPDTWDLTDPATATPQPDPTTTTAPGGGTSAFPTEVPLPTPTVTAPPSGAPTPPPVPVPNESGVGGSDCWDSATASWNPVDWVLTPVKCALVWAFVPPGGLEPRLSEFGDAWGGSDIGTWVGTLSAPMTDISGAFSGGGSGCGGPEWTLSLSMFGGGSYPFRPFDSCREPLASVAPIVKAVATALVLVIGFRAVANPMLGAMGLPRIPGRASLRRDEVVSGGH